ncbi:MAG: alcohol dehydrogenase catalytic domain-containing protein [Clostridia bacterium]|jgi:threonine dehydrogenase-like Zn-dependent dehydrogenase|nr:alcohol dehydrogenase catalytic domain-containing protein [Clostridia bacterium]
MKVWQLAYPHNIQRAAAPDLKLTEGKVKVKITKALLSETDVSVYDGSLKVKAPFIPGRFAIGQVTEANEDSFIRKGERVYLAGVTEDELAPDGLRIAGETVDGFYRDFALVGVNDVYSLPSSVSDEAAFLIDAIALAEHVVDEMHIEAGQHILVLGGGLYGNILCQILIYHRAVPILADNNAERLARAKKSGIYYTYPNDDTLKQNVLNITGGKLADGAVYLAYANRCDPAIMFPLVKRDSYVAFCSLMSKSLQVNLEYAMKNNVTIKGITESREFVSTAINLLANKAVSFAEFSFRNHREEELPELLKQYAEAYAVGGALPEQFDIVKFIF